MKTPTPSEQDRIDEEAGEWIVRLSEPDFPTSDQAAFDAWLATSPIHERTWEQMLRTWDDVSGMSHLSSLAALQANDEDVAGGYRRSRRLWLPTIAAAAAAAVLALLIIPQYFSVAGRSYSTQLAQIQKVNLPDGTVVTMGPRSNLSVVAYNSTERRIRLTGGEAFFEVKHDASRPFFVEAGTSTVRVLGTKFDVKRGDGATVVSVLEGVVRVTERSTPKARTQPVETVRTLTAGMLAEVRTGPAAEPTGAHVAVAPTTPIITTMGSQSSGAWRDGRLVYDNARVADLVADLNRYSDKKIVLKDASVGELRISASLNAEDIPTFVGAMGDVVPVTTVRRSDGTIEIGPRNN